jgi:hypothetical protein
VRDRLIDGLIQGDRLAWAALGVLWLVTAAVVLLHRPGKSGAAWTWILLATATATSIAGLSLSAAIAVPRLRWETVAAPDLIAEPAEKGAGRETWRRLRGPAVEIAGADLAVPTIDTSGRWVLVGLLSGHAVEGLPAAEPAPIPPGATRLCPTEGETCRPWPVAWPDPARHGAQAELSWTRAEPTPGLRATTLRTAREPSATAEGNAVERALAYDVETGLYLVRVEPAAPVAMGPQEAPSPAPPAPPRTRAELLAGPHLEITGRLAAEAPREGTSVLLVVRRIAGGQLRAARVIAAPATSGLGHVFRLQRAHVSLTAGPTAFAWVARPLLALTSFSLPLGVLALLLAPFVRRTDRETAAAWLAPRLAAFAVLAAGLAAAAPAVVAMASLWGSR